MRAHLPYFGAAPQLGKRTGGCWFRWEAPKVAVGNCLLGLPGLRGLRGFLDYRMGTLTASEVICSRAKMRRLVVHVQVASTKHPPVVK